MKTNLNLAIADGWNIKKNVLKMAQIFLNLWLDGEIVFCITTAGGGNKYDYNFILKVFHER